MQLPFRLARGVTVALAILLAHFAIAWLFDHLRIPRPDLGPVFATLLGDLGAETDSTRPLAPKPASTAPASSVSITLPDETRPEDAGR
jgi:hypothetical protein